MAAQTFSALTDDALSVADEATGSGSTQARTLIQAGINESYSEIAAARDWETLKTDVGVTTATGTMEYTPVNSGSVARIRRIISVIDETNNNLLEEVTEKNFNTVYPYVSTSSSANQGSPRLWFISGYDSNNDVKIKVYPVPNSVMTLRVKHFFEPLALTSDTDKPLIPDQFHYGLEYKGLAKYFEYVKDPIASYWLTKHEDFKQKILDFEYGPTEEMPQMQTQGRNRGFVTGKLGRVYNR